MRCTRCGICCQETDMLLSNQDITKLGKKGYTRDFFVRFNSDGYALLRNRQGCCVFYNPAQKQCSVYASRPAGCRVYPVICDEKNNIIIDEICRAQESINNIEKSARGKRVLKLLERIDQEAKNRTK
jgi:Fe-S-cluster containining protein